MEKSKYTDDYKRRLNIVRRVLKLKKKNVNILYEDKKNLSSEI